MISKDKGFVEKYQVLRRRAAGLTPKIAAFKKNFLFER
jgi:hypothetical protein